MINNLLSRYGKIYMKYKKNMPKFEMSKAKPSTTEFNLQ